MRQAEEVVPGVRRLVANNPGPFTYTGTATYIVGRGNIAIVDPGPNQESHLAALFGAINNETITHVFVTHTHLDHSGAVRRVKELTGALVVAGGVHHRARALRPGEVDVFHCNIDWEFRPDTIVAEGQMVRGQDWALEAIPTPGHTANHMAFALEHTGILFSGDHVMGHAGSIVAPPDGRMSDYVASLRKLLQRPESTYLPGHGAPVCNARRLVERCIRRRLGAEAAILRRLSRGPADIDTIAKAVYIGVDPPLRLAASLLVLAHIEDLLSREIVTRNVFEPTVETFRLL